MAKRLIDRYRALPLRVRASGWFLMCSVLQKGISVITTPIFTRLLTTAQYGRFSVFNAWFWIIIVFVTLQTFSGVYMQGLVKYEDRRKEFTSSLQGLCLTMVAAWTLIYLVFHDFFNSLFTLSTTQMLLMLVMIWTTSVFNFWSVEQRVELRYRALIIVTLIVIIAKPLLGVIFVLVADDPVTARILSLVLVELMAYSWMFLRQMHEGKKFFSREFWLYAILFNIPLIPHFLSITVLSFSDRIMIERLTDSSSAGIYSLAYAVAQLMSVFDTALMTTFEPWLYQRIKQRRIEDMARIAYPAFILMASVNLILIAFAPEIIYIFAPSPYHEAIWVVPPIAMSVFFSFGYSFFAVFEFYFEKTHLITAATLSGAILNIVLNLIFIKKYGYLAAGYTTLVCYMVFAIYHFVFMKRICRRELDGASPYSAPVLSAIAIAFMALGFLLLGTYNAPLLRFGIIAVMLILAIFNRKRILKAVDIREIL